MKNWSAGQLKLISGLQQAKFTLWASFNLPSSQAKVTSVNSLSKLEKYYFTVTSVLMHALILVIWGDTTTANWREPYQCYQCDYNFFASQLLRLHTKIELCIFQALDIADVNDFFFTLWLSKLQIAALSKASMQNVKLNSASLAFLNVWSTS